MHRKVNDRISPLDLDSLMSALRVDSVRLDEFQVHDGWCLASPATDMPMLCYALVGRARMLIAGMTPIDLAPHTLVIAPSNRPFRVEVLDDESSAPCRRLQIKRDANYRPGTRRIAAGTGDAGTHLACGFFRASFGGCIDLFSGLKTTVVEQFAKNDQLDRCVGYAISEIAGDDVGAASMMASILKLVLISVMRRALKSSNSWIHELSILSDPQITQSFVCMVAHPEAPHSLRSLAQTAGLGRALFVSRFFSAFDESPIVVLRDLRMQLAARMFMGFEYPTVEDVAVAVGYASRSGFIRAFRKVHGCVPSTYRAGYANALMASAGKR
jgi:AraC-like DNA-binding protein